MTGQRRLLADSCRPKLWAAYVWLASPPLPREVMGIHPADANFPAVEELFQEWKSLRDITETTAARLAPDDPVTAILRVASAEANEALTRWHTNSLPTLTEQANLEQAMEAHAARVQEIEEAKPFWLTSTMD